MEMAGLEGLLAQISDDDSFECGRENPQKGRELTMLLLRNSGCVEERQQQSSLSF